MHLDSDVRKLAGSVTRWSILFCVIEVILAAVLAAAGIIRFRIGMILTAAGGTAVVTGCFWWMAASLQKSLDKAVNEGSQIKKGVQTGYTKRLLVQALWIAVDILVPHAVFGAFQAGITICGLIPLLFPRFAIYGLQISGRKKQKAGSKGGEN